MPVVARGDNQECYFTAAEDFLLLLAHLRELVRTYEVAVYATTLMSTHMHCLLQAPTHEALGRPLRWVLTETAKAFHKARGWRGHFWERRDRACLVEEDSSALAALRSLDRNPVRAGIVTDLTTYSWSRCAAYALETPNPLITFDPSYLALSPYPKSRQRQYRALVAPSPDPIADAHDPRWSTRRTVGTAAFVARYTPTAWPPQNCFRASANSYTWREKGVRYLFGQKQKRRSDQGHRANQLASGRRAGCDTRHPPRASPSGNSVPPKSWPVQGEGIGSSMFLGSGHHDTS
jgi:putative transposase